MWHEARKHEKKLRVLIVDYRRRAERRREYYEKFKADPTQFMQVHGRPSKIHMDSQITAAADNCMMPWQGNADNMIDRFDARAHLDRIPDAASTASETAGDIEASNSNGKEEAALNYERFRILIQNDLAGTSEDKFLHQIYVEEQFGTPTQALLHGGKAVADANKSKPPKAAIGYTYDDSNPSGTTMTAAVNKVNALSSQSEEAAPADEDSDEDLDFDLLVNVKDLNLAQQAELNNGGVKYGMAAGDFMRYLNAELEEKEQMRLAKLQEEEKQTMSGRKARRERRAYKDRIIMRKGYVSPPSYAARANSPPAENYRSASRSESRSVSPVQEKITYITSFGENSDEDKKNNSKGVDTIFGPILPPDGLPLAKKWNRRKSHSPKRRIVRSRTRSRSRTRKDFGNHSRISSAGRNRRRRSSSSSDRSFRNFRSSRSRRSSPKIRKNRSRSRRRGRSRDRRHSKNLSSRSTSRRSSHSRSRSRNRTRRGRRSRSRSRSDSRTRDRYSKKSPKRSRRKSRSHSLRLRSRSRSRNHRSQHSHSSSSSSSESSPSPVRRSGSTDTPGRKTDILRKTITKEVKLPSSPVKRYYDKAKAKAAHEKESSGVSTHSSDSSDSEIGNAVSSAGRRLSVTKGSVRVPDHEEKSIFSTPGKPNVNTSSKVGSASGGKLTPQERLKRRMQQQLNRQLKADKEAEKSRLEKQVQERMEREESLRELSIKYRRREREKRHRTQAMASDSSKSTASSRSNSRSRSASPCVEF